jgi:phosphoenolpyruvate synthase/pyruvate phosphate dikinase
MDGIVNSPKIKGLETLIKKRIRVPEFTWLSAYEEMNIDYCALHPEYRITSLFNIIEQKLKSLGPWPYGYSLRSASFDEDNSMISSAGKYKSYNGLQSLDNIYKAAIFIWKHHRALAPPEIKCQLILQKTHCSYFSGVFFRDKDQCLIESYYGSCRSIVDGMILPYRTIYRDDQIKHSFQSQKTEIYKFQSHPGLFKNATTTTPAGSLLEPVKYPFPTRVRRLTEEEQGEWQVYGYRPADPPEWYEKKICERLIKISSKLDNSRGQDIEWGVNVDGKLYIYQFRPLTRPLPSLESLSQPQLTSEEPLILSDSKYIHGVVASPGVCKGIISAEQKIHNKNTILLLREATIDNVDVVASCGGVICQRGGLLSHLAIICRELQIPCLLGIEMYLPDGTAIKLDADKGRIELL